MEFSRGIVIAGGGLAAQRCCEALRRLGYEGRIRVVCAEAERPYDRPPLSKEALLGDVDVSLRPAGWYADNDVELLLGERAVAVGAGRLELAGSAPIEWDRLLIATGARARTLPLLEPFENVQVLRTLADAQRLRSVLRPGARLAIVGAGFVGQEVAASARSAGVEVTMIDAAPSPLAGVIGATWAAWLMDLHRAEGVDVVLGEGIAAVHGAGRVEALELIDGRLVPCDHVLVGIGITPNAEILTPGPLPPGVFAAGDCVAGTQHWEAAGRQARAAARGMLGLEPPAAVPDAFWSDQYGLRIQFVGDIAGADSVEVGGDPASRSFHVVHRRGGCPLAAFLVDRRRELPALRRLVAAACQSKEIR